MRSSLFLLSAVAALAFAAASPRDVHDGSTNDSVTRPEAPDSIDVLDSIAFAGDISSLSAVAPFRVDSTADALLLKPLATPEVVAIALECQPGLVVPSSLRSDRRRVHRRPRLLASSTRRNVEVRLIEHSARG